MEKSVAELSHRDWVTLDKDYEKVAAVADLEYRTDGEPGIERLKKGNQFVYRFNGKQIRDATTLDRIRRLAIPPAWTRVWIAPIENGHIQATGFDVRGRKQYRYHPRWSAIQQETKFHRMYEFGKSLAALRERIASDLRQSEFTETKALATVLSVMDRTNIRIGNEGYEKQNGSYGLTTLKNDHVRVRGDEVVFSFKGKKGVYHKVMLKSKKFARLISQCKAIPGKELFQYYDAQGNLRKVDSGRVNQYIRDIMQQDFSTKDFRTWSGTVHMLQALRNAPECELKSDYQKNIKQALTEVSNKLGNTTTVCKKYYVHPGISELYTDNELAAYFKKHSETTTASFGLSEDEEILMKILKALQKKTVCLPD